MKARVAVVRTHPDRVLEDIDTLMDMAGIDSALDKTKTTILKDNISWHYPLLSANTTPWQLEGTVRALQQRGCQKLCAVHNNTVVTDPFKGSRLNKLDIIYKRYGIEEKYNFVPADIRWIRYEPKGKMLALNQIYPDGIYIPEYFLDKNIVHLPTVKCHIYTTTTGAMTNAFGGLLNTRRHYTHTMIHETLADLLRIQQEIHSGIFTVMDGTLCGNGPGPRTMVPVEKDLILASSDSVAIDAVAAKMMGFSPMDIRYIRLAHELGLGVGRVEEIEVVGEDVSKVNFGFTVGANLAGRFGHSLWFGPFKKVQRVFFRTPLVYLFVMGSYFYHDVIWWRLKGKRSMKGVREESKWGKLFATY
jgi:uncharacterized protein (DUF362 family)